MGEPKNIKNQEPKIQDPKKEYKGRKECKKYKGRSVIGTPFEIYDLNILWILVLGFLVLCFLLP